MEKYCEILHDVLEIDYKLRAAGHNQDCRLPRQIDNQEIIEKGSRN